MNQYSIIIPIYNEKESIPYLLSSLDIYLNEGNEIIIIDDGSTDGSSKILKNNKKITLIEINSNKGKGYAIRKGLKKATNNKIVIFDGDLEIHTSEIRKLMVLDKSNNIFSTMGYRFEDINPFNSAFDFGNYFFRIFYNFLFQSQQKDVLCCAKSFYIEVINSSQLQSKGFDIDIEISYILSVGKSLPNPLPIKMHYRRRKVNDGKKLKISDGWVILIRIINLYKNNYLKGS